MKHTHKIPILSLWNWNSHTTESAGLHVQCEHVYVNEFILHFGCPQGLYCFAHVGLSVGPSTKWFPDVNSITRKPRIMIHYWYNDYDWHMSPIDFQVTSSKVKVTLTRNSKIVSG
jgi:hypothetical protein